jgi:hypothetical protein
MIVDGEVVEHGDGSDSDEGNIIGGTATPKAAEANDTYAQLLTMITKIDSRLDTQAHAITSLVKTVDSMQQ